MQTNDSKITISAIAGSLDKSQTLTCNRSEANNTDQLQMTDCDYLHERQVKSRIDYLCIQFNPKSESEFSLAKTFIEQYLNTIGIECINANPNLKYFDHGKLLQAADETKSYCGSIKWRHDWSAFQLDLTGKGCNYFNTNKLYVFPLIELTKILNFSIKRLDIALDSFTKKHGLRFLQQAYSRGLYSPSNGMRPTKETISSSAGKSVTIGSRHSAKQIIGYEKGKQLGFPKQSKEFKNWFRFEVRLKGRVKQKIPIEALLCPDDFFVGAYPKAHQRLIKSAEPRCIKREVIKAIDKKLMDKLAYAKHQVGKTIYGAVNRGLPSEVIVSRIIRKSKKDNIEYPSFISGSDLTTYKFGD